MKPYQPIEGRGIDGAHRSDLPTRLVAADYRRRREAVGLCINGASHGPATHGKKCKRCAAVRRFGVALVERVGLDQIDFSDRRFKQFPSAAHAA